MVSPSQKHAITGVVTSEFRDIWNQHKICRAIYATIKFFPDLGLLKAIHSDSHSDFWVHITVSQWQTTVSVHTPSDPPIPTYNCSVRNIVHIVGQQDPNKANFETPSALHNGEPNYNLVILLICDNFMIMTSHTPPLILFLAGKNKTLLLRCFSETLKKTAFLKIIFTLTNDKTVFKWI